MSWLLLLATALSVSESAPGIDYDKIPYVLKKEPAYPSAKPGYARLLFGREARLVIWIVLDGTTLYIDRDGDGDLTDANERFADLKDCRNLELHDPDGKTRYVIVSVKTNNHYYSEEELRDRAAKGIVSNLEVGVEIKGPVEYEQRCDLQELWNDPEKARLAHFHGPLTVELLKYNYQIPPGLTLNAIKGEAEVVAFVGTMNEKHGCWVVLGSSLDTDRRPVPADVHPAVEIEYPTADPNAAPLRRKYELQEFC